VGIPALQRRRPGFHDDVLPPLGILVDDEMNLQQDPGKPLPQERLGIERVCHRMVLGRLLEASVEHRRRDALPKIEFGCLDCEEISAGFDHGCEG